MHMIHVYILHMDTRIHILLREADKARYRHQAEREGLSLGAWLREAAEEKLASARSRRFASADDLRAFFDGRDECETDPEPDWDEHRRVIARSRTTSSGPT
jgi:hypothetical protein